MGCNVCGNPKSEYRFNKHQSLCDACNRETPKKLGFSQFVLAYFGQDALETVPASTRKEFYDDYKTSTLNIEDYISQTTETV